MTADTKTETFFAVLFEGKTGFIEIRSIRRGYVKRQFFELPHEIQDAATSAVAMGGDVIFGVLPRIRKSGKNEDVIEVYNFWVDADSDACPWKDFPLPPTAVAESGSPGHYHAYWALTEPLSTKEAPVYLKALTLALNADAQATDIARCLRVPGTINTKQNARCVILELDATRLYGVKAMRHGITIALITPFWIEGKRQALALSFAGFLAKAGVPAEEAKEFFEALTSHTNDEEAEVRLRALLGSYQKLGKGEQVLGYKGLKELLPGEELDALAKLWSRPMEMRHALPVIRVDGRFLRDLSADSVSALCKSNERKPEIFTRGGAIVRLHRDKYGLVAQAFTPPALKGRLDRSADYIVQKGGRERPARPPDDVVADILSWDGLPFLELRGIALSPVVVAGGRLVSTPGYDQESGLYLDLNRVNIGERMPLREAVQWINQELLGDFPFVDDASRAHGLALIIQPFVRDLIDDPTPLYLIDAPSQGTGKGLEAEVTSQVAIGQPAAVMTQPRSEDEVRKRITALLLAGHPLIALDNVHQLHSAALCAVLTSRVWEDRILGRSQMVRLRNSTTWMATGNNVELSAEMARRVVLIRLDAGVERPEERTDFRHPQLLRWARAHRSELVTAVLSIVHAWVDAGMPAGEGTMGRFEEWVRVLGGILQVAHVDGFLSNRQRLYEDSDHESREWVAFCTLWWERFGTSSVTAGDLFEPLRERRMLLDVLAGRSVLASQQRLGHALANRRDRIFGTWRIRCAGRSSKNGSITYRLEEIPRGAAASKTPKTTETMEGEAEVEVAVSVVSVVSQTSDGSENLEYDGWQEV